MREVLLRYLLDAISSMYYQFLCYTYSTVPMVYLLYSFYVILTLQFLWYTYYTVSMVYLLCSFYVILTLQFLCYTYSQLYLLGKMPTDRLRDLFSS